MTIESVTSFLGTGLEGPAGDLSEVDLLWAENDWLAESRWQRRRLRDALPDLDVGAHGSDPRGRLGFTSVGSWSSGTFLPMGAAVNRRTGHAWVWQVEHNGAWHWQVGEHTGREATSEHHGPGPASAYLALLGPTDAEHQWRVTLGPGEWFETVPVAVALSTEGLEGAVGRLTHYRRAIRRPHQDHRRLPVIFNDYMNTLMGDPTTERLVPLITAAARVGAECFCIDAGWYAETDEQWWDAVGMWQPSTTRFPNGITEVLELIRAQGMVPGLWLEPEVVGVRSPLAHQLPPGAFFARDGQRVVEHGRYHLDLSHAAHAATWTGWSISWSVTSASATSSWTTTSMLGRGQPAGGPALVPACWRIIGPTWTGWTPPSTVTPVSLWRTAHRAGCVPTMRCCRTFSSSPPVTSRISPATRPSPPPSPWR